MRGFGERIGALAVLLILSGPVWAGDTPLHTAAEKGDIRTAEKLLAEGMDVNVRDQEKRTPLQRALEKKQAEFARWILSRGAVATARDQFQLRRLGIDRKTAPRPAKRPGAPSVYDDIARATGGAVYKFPKGNLEGMSDIMIATLGAENVLNRQIDLEGKTRVRLPVSNLAGTVTITVTAIQGKPRVHLVDPMGANYSKTDSKNGIRRIDLENGAVFLMDNPTVGDWWIQLQGRGDLHVLAQVKKGSVATASGKAGGGSIGTLEIHDFQFVELKGRPGHEGYFKSDLPLVPGETREAMVTLFDAPEEIRFHLVTPQGKALPDEEVKKIPGDEGGNDHLLSVVIPQVPFKIQVQGERGKEMAQAVSRKTFTPDKNMRVVVFDPAATFGIEECQTAKFFLQVIQTDTPGAAGAIRCTITRTQPLKLEFEMRFYIPRAVLSKGGGTEFFPDARYKYDDARCAEIKRFVDRFENQSRSGNAGAHRQTSCSQEKGKTRFTMHLTFSGN